MTPVAWPSPPLESVPPNTSNIHDAGFMPAGRGLHTFTSQLN
jgi:hypothetical protein